MKFAIPDFDPGDLDLAGSATIGAESLLSLSWDDVIEVGTLVQTGATTGSWTGQPGYDTATARDLVIFADNGLLSAAQIEITFDVHYDAPGTTVGTAKAILIPPSYALNTGFNFPQAFALDLTVQGSGNSGKKIFSIDGLNAITGGKTNNRLRVMALPETFHFVACVKDKNPGFPSPKSVAIACGYDASRWIKKGRSEVPTLECSAAYTSYGDGLMRANGHRLTAMIETVKDDRLLTERAIFTGWRPTVTARRGDGDTEDEARATGNYEAALVFTV
jgi:hypothetical protein